MVPKPIKISLGYTAQCFRVTCWETPASLKQPPRPFSGADLGTARVLPFSRCRRLISAGLQFSQALKTAWVRGRGTGKRQTFKHCHCKEEGCDEEQLLRNHWFGKWSILDWRVQVYIQQVWKLECHHTAQSYRFFNTHSLKNEQIEIYVSCNHSLKQNNNNNNNNPSVIVDNVDIKGRKLWKQTWYYINTM